MSDQIEKKLQVIPRDELKQLAPAAFTKTNHLMSAKYVHVPTVDVIDVMESNGFLVTQAAQDKPLRRDPKYVRHNIILTHEDAMKHPMEAAPQISLINSGNGRTKLSMRAGFYRFVCTNGLIVGRDFADFQVIHSGDFKAEIERGIQLISDQTNQAMSVIDRWINIELSKRKMTEFAEQALKIRFGDQASNYDPAKVLEATRYEDEGRSLWRVFNRVQEKFVQGGIPGVSANQRNVTSRAITNIQANTEVNQNLWDLAASFAK